MTDWYIISGYTSKQELINNGTKLRDLPIQLDQDAGRVWIKRPGEGAGLVVPAKLVDALTGERRAYGGFTFDWPMLNLSPKMANHLKTTYFGGGYFGKVTVQLFNRETGDFEAYNAIARWPNVKQSAQMAGGGLNDLIISFVNASLATEGPELSPGLADSGDWDYLQSSTFTTTITNNGDDETFNQVEVIVDLGTPKKVDYSSSSHTNWSISYSTDGGLNYSGTPPGDLTTITHVRYTRTDRLANGSSYENIVLTLSSNSAGSHTLTSTVTTDGDTNPANDSSASNIVIDFVPTDLSNCVQWLDGSDASKLFTDAAKTTPVSSDDDPVGAWEDGSGSANDVTQATAADKGTYKTSIQNGLSIVRFDGTSDHLSGGNIGIENSDFTMFAVISSANQAGVYHWVGSSVSATPKIEHSHQTTPLDRLTRTSDTGGGDTITLDNSSGANNTWQVRVHRKNGDNYLNRIDRSDQTGSKTFSGTLTTDTTSVAAEIPAGTPGTFFNGDIGELIIYSRSLTDDEVTIVEEYLEEKWSITLP